MKKPMSKYRLNKLAAEAKLKADTLEHRAKFVPKKQAQELQQKAAVQRETQILLLAEVASK